MLPNLAIIYVNMAHKDTPTIKPACDLVCYIEEDVIATRVKLPLALKAGQPPFIQSFLAFDNMRNLILETQGKPLTNSYCGSH